MRRGLSIALAVILAALICVRIITLRHAASRPAIVDRSVTDPLNQPGAGFAPPEAYEIYSALYQAPMNEPLVFAENSATDIPQVNGNCLKPSTRQQREMANSFEAANRQSRKWEKRFVIPAGYRLISQAEVPDALACLDAHGQKGAQCENYTHLEHLRFLGVPGFDQSRTRALVSVLKKCGRYCGSGGIFEVEKSGGAWRRSEPGDFTRDCSWMY